MTIPNLITLLRVLLVPVIVWALLTSNPKLAFGVFFLAGVSDAVDGALARYLNQQTALGTWLDPIADKTMLVSVFIVLGILDHLPIWLVILVVSRDLIIIVGVMLVFMLVDSVTIRPLWVSKANTVAQIVLAAFVLGMIAFEIEAFDLKMAMVWITGVLTTMSAVAYMVQGLRVLSEEHPSKNEEENL